MSDDKQAGPEDWAAMMATTQKMWMDAWADSFGASAQKPGLGFSPPPGNPMGADPMELMNAGAKAWTDGMQAWGQMMADMQAAGSKPDRRFRRRNGRPIRCSPR